MIGVFGVAGVMLAVGVLVILAQIGATRTSRAPDHENGRSER